MANTPPPRMRPRISLGMTRQLARKSKASLLIFAGKGFSGAGFNGRRAPLKRGDNPTKRFTSTSTPGTAANRNTLRSGQPAASNVAASKGPMTAPVWSRARCKPKARPRAPGSTTSAISESRGEVRRPLPTRSRKRNAMMTGQPNTLPASPIHGRAVTDTV